MITPMFLMPREGKKYNNFLTINYYVDGQIVGGGKYTLNPSKPTLDLYPKSYSGGVPVRPQVKYSNFAYPIAGFEDGWRDENGIPYPGPEISLHQWVGKTYIHPKPLGPKKGMLEVDLIDSSATGYRGIGIAYESGVYQDAVFFSNTPANSSVHEQNLSDRNDVTGYSNIVNFNLPLASSMGRYVGVTVEIS